MPLLLFIPFLCPFDDIAIGLLAGSCIYRLGRRIWRKVFHG